MSYTYEQLAPEYQQLWDTMKIIRDAENLHKISEKIKAHQAVYQQVQAETGVPWQLIAVIHLREAGQSDIGTWKRVLHNGQRIVGTGKQTTIVPKGRGPFTTWHEAAVDALRLKGFDKIKEWPVSRYLWALEPYNGYGYRNKGLRSPYLWASTNHQQLGKYVEDHVFDPNVMDTQIGCAAMLKFLDVGKPAPAKPKIAEPTAAAGTVGGGLAAMWKWGTEHPVEVAVGVAVTGLLIWFIIHRYRKYKQRKNNV